MCKITSQCHHYAFLLQKSSVPKTASASQGFLWQKPKEPIWQLVHWSIVSHCHNVAGKEAVFRRSQECRCIFFFFFFTFWVSIISRNAGTFQLLWKQNIPICRSIEPCITKSHRGTSKPFQSHIDTFIEKKLSNMLFWRAEMSFQGLNECQEKNSNHVQSGELAL